jgi:hypothetical protein
VLGVACSISLIALAWAAEAQAQCDWTTDYATYKVRSVSFKVAAVFGKVPEALKLQLSRHRSDLYTSDKPNEYANEAMKFYNNDPAALKYEQLVASKLKFSFKGFLYKSCAEKVNPTECEREFKGDPGGPVTQCLDVVVQRSGVAIDALNTMPFLVLFPRSTLVKLLGAIPRPLMALNPGIDFDFDKEFGPSAMIDTSMDLLNMRPMFKNSSRTAKTANQETPTSVTPTTQAPATVITDDTVNILVTPQGGAKVFSGEATPTPDPRDFGRDSKLLLNIKAQKSFDKSFYNTETGLVFSRTKALGRFQNLALEAKFRANNGPQGAGTLLQNSVTAGGSADVTVKTGPFKLVNLGGKYRWSSNRFFSPSTAPELTSENAIEGRVIADGNIKKGLLRVAAWFDSGWPAAQPNSYQRLAVVAAYSKEFVIPRKKVEFHKIAPPGLSQCYTPYKETPKTNDPSIGVEIIAGAGRAWGDVPEYARFYGGNSSTNFLYDEPSAQTLTAFPGGPLLRSAKRQQAGILTRSGAILGGTSYWHLNANVSLPIPGWSQPLIPGELVAGSVPDKDERDQGVPGDALVCRDLKYVLKTQVRKSGTELLVAREAHDSLSKAQQDALRLNPKDPNLSAAQRQALSDATAAYNAEKDKKRKAAEDMMRNEITPITDFIADHADIYSIKPLMMVEAARLAAADAIMDQTRFGFGGGLQVNVVTVRFEAGYLFAANRLPGDAHGNFVFRLVFRRFF